MSVAVEVPPELLSLVKALGLVGADGRVNSTWLSIPSITSQLNPLRIRISAPPCSR